MAKVIGIVIDRSADCILLKPDGKGGLVGIETRTSNSIGLSTVFAKETGSTLSIDEQESWTYIGKSTTSILEPDMAYYYLLETRLVGTIKVTGKEGGVFNSSLSKPMAGICPTIKAYIDTVINGPMMFADFTIAEDSQS